MAPRPLVHSLEGTGTPNGQSFIMELGGGCPRRAYLNQVTKNVGLDDPKLLIGSILHAYLALYYTTLSDRWSAGTVKFTNAPSVNCMDIARREGERLFRAYRARFPPKEIGKVVAIEKLLPEGKIVKRKGQQPQLIPDKKAQAQRISDAVGFPGYNLRPDLVTKNGVRSIARLNKTREGLSRLRKPGYYGWDWKSVAFLSASTIDFYRDLPQFQFYQLGWNAAFPARKLNGMIVCLITKTTTPEIYHVVVPPPRLIDIRMVKNISRRALYVLETQKPPFEANPKCCYDWHRQCEFMYAGLCKRS